jgi:hypothetical protein
MLDSLMMLGCYPCSTMSGLKALLQLTKMYCEKFQVKLVGSKTKLLVFTTRQTKMIA